MHRPPSIASALVLLALSSGCTMKQTAGSRNSGQSHLMDQTFAGQNACNAEEHTKPFVIEWDATDMSSFESLAASDIVFVKYEGCTLRVLDECKNDSFRGEQGAYKPPEWTTGQLESVEIQNSGELVAKLPLAQATLGARVSGGEQFHMEYYVAGTRYASRDAVYEKDLEGRYGCEDATHFVYGFNLGAFALGSANELNVEAGASAFGFGAKGTQSSSSKADKKGGDLAVCSSDSATEVAGCKAPIRLNLREIRPGQSAEAVAMATPDDAESLTAAGVINQKLEMSDEARAHYDAAMAKANAGDGKGCLKELDGHDKLNPTHKSTDPKSPGVSMLRAQCVMRAGKCKAGKGQMRKAFENTNMAEFGPEHIDRSVDAMAAMYCEGDLDPTDGLRKALSELNKGAYMTKKSSEFCTTQWKTAEKLIPKAKPRDDDDSQIIDADKALFSMVPNCFARAGDCKMAYTSFKSVSSSVYPNYSDMTEEQMRNNFESLVSKCKGK